MLMRSAFQISVHRARWLRVHRSCHSGLGWVSAVLFSPSTDSAGGGVFSALGCGVFRWWKSESWRARGPKQPVGHCRVWGNRISQRVSCRHTRIAKELWTIDGDTIRWLGVALFAAGGALRIWPVFVLGNRFSGLVAIQPGHTLVTSGIYGVIRHPSYLGLLINSLGWSLAFRSGVGVLLTVLLIPPLLARIDAEENLLYSQFGDNYNAYRSHTWRLIPGIY